MQKKTQIILRGKRSNGTSVWKLGCVSTQNLHLHTLRGGELMKVCHVVIKCLTNKIMRPGVLRNQWCEGFFLLCSVTKLSLGCVLKIREE